MKIILDDIPIEDERINKLYYQLCNQIILNHFNINNTNNNINFFSN